MPSCAHCLTYSTVLKRFYIILVYTRRSARAAMTPDQNLFKTCGHLWALKALPLGSNLWHRVWSSAGHRLTRARPPASRSFGWQAACIRRRRMRLPGNHCIVHCTGRRKLICGAAAGDVIHTICCRRADGDGFQSSAMMQSEREREVDQTRARSMPDTVTDGVRQAVVPPASPFLTRGKDMEP